jgi:ribonuclease P protein component
MSQRFAGVVRLRSRADFTLVQQRGRRLATRYITLLVLPNSRPVDRLGIVASRKIGGAVIRNTAKRRLRDIFRRLQPDRAAERHRWCLDIVAIVRQELTKAPLAVVEPDFIAALDRLRARCRP